jgi:2-C-methyl-D-erythritol 2,4-cyclodiphosphate synthase
MIRVGIGQDSHRFDNFSENESLILGGIKIDTDLKFQANSDGDVVLHSLCNALGSAIGLSSISTYADKMCLEEKIIDSRKYVEYIFQKVKEKGYKIQNISISLEAKKPKLEKHFPEMKKSIANLLETEIENIGITATSGEELTAFGKGEGIQVFAIVCIIKK